MADIYRAEITIWGFAPDAVDLADPTTGATYTAYFSAGDDFNTWGIAVTAVPEPTALVGYRLRYEFYINATGDPNGWSLVSGTNTVNVDDETFTFSVKTIAIQKNYDDDTLTYIIPGGSQNYDKTLSGFVKDTSVMRPKCHGNGIVLFSGTEPSGGSVTFRDFYGYRNNHKFIGASLDSGDPGVFTATTQYTTGPNPAVPNTDAQTAFGYLMGYLQSSPPAARAPTRRMRCWDDGDNISEAEPFWVDAVVSPVTGTLFAVVVREGVPDTLEVYRSTDNGNTFSFDAPLAFSGEQYSWPQIMVDPRGRVVIFYNNGQRGKVNYIVSYTDGMSWADPAFYNVFDLFTGNPTTLEAPRFRIDMVGVVMGLWNSKGTGELVGQRFTVLGVSPTSALFIVDSGLTEFPRSDLYWKERGEARAFYRKGGTGQLRGSVTWGRIWYSITSGRPTEVRQSSVADAARGVSYHAYQDTGSIRVEVGRSSDGGETFDNAAEISGINVADQYPALAVGQRGQLFAFEFQGVTPKVLHCFRSPSWGVNWVDTGATFP